MYSISKRPKNIAGTFSSNDEAHPHTWCRKLQCQQNQYQDHPRKVRTDFLRIKLSQTTKMYISSKYGQQPLSHTGWFIIYYTCTLWWWLPCSEHESHEEMFTLLHFALFDIWRGRLVAETNTIFNRPVLGCKVLQKVFSHYDSVIGSHCFLLKPLSEPNIPLKHEQKIWGLLLNCIMFKLTYSTHTQTWAEWYQE